MAASSPTPFSTALAQQLTDLQSMAGRTAFYTRVSAGETQPFQLTAVPGESRYEVDDGHGVLSERVIHDEIVDAADLVVGGATFEPAEGDTIGINVDTLGESQRVTYVVRPPGDGEPAWHYAGADRSRIRIHTKHLESAPLGGA